MVRGSCGMVLVRRELGCELTAIVWIARPRVAHCAELIMKCLNVIHVDHLPFHVLQLHYVHKGEIFKEGFHVLK